MKLNKTDRPLGALAEVYSYLKRTA